MKNKDLYELTEVLTGIKYEFAFDKICNEKHKMTFVPHQKKIHIPRISGISDSDVMMFRHNNNDDVNLHIIMVPNGIIAKTRRVSDFTETIVTMSTGWMNAIIEEKFNITVKDINDIGNKLRPTPTSKSTFSVGIDISDFGWYKTYNTGQPQYEKSRNYGLCLSLNAIFYKAIQPNLHLIGK